MDPALAVVIAAIIAAVASIASAYLARKDRRWLRETHIAVTKNGGHNNPPTVIDKLHEIQAGLAEVKAVQIAQDVKIDVLWQNQVANNEDKSK